jgi:hypothetical protein
MTGVASEEGGASRQQSVLKLPSIHLKDKPSHKEMDYVDFGLDRVGFDCWVHWQQASEQDW